MSAVSVVISAGRGGDVVRSVSGVERNRVRTCAMIKLEVEDYCQNCPEFEAEVKKSHAIAIGRGLKEEPVNETIVKCERSAQCEAIMKYVRETLWTMKNC